MTTAERIEQIKAEALKLPKHEPESVAREFFAAGEELADFDADDDDNITDAFVSELERRRDSVRNGTAELIPADVVFAQLRARFSQLRARMTTRIGALTLEPRAVRARNSPSERICLEAVHRVSILCAWSLFPCRSTMRVFTL